MGVGRPGTAAEPPGRAVGWVTAGLQQGRVGVDVRVGQEAILDTVLEW